MGWILKYFNKLWPRNPSGPHLNYEEPHWCISGIPSYPKFFQVLGELIPENSILCLQSCHCPKGLKTFFSQASISSTQYQKNGGPVLRPECIYIPATRVNLRTLSELTEHFVAIEIAEHCHVCLGPDVIIEWHDVFDRPMIMSSYFAEQRLKRFCQEHQLDIQPCYLCEKFKEVAE